MSDAIEILKKIFETNKSVMFEDEKDALKKGILALEQKEKLVKILYDARYLIEGNENLKAIDHLSQWIKEIEKGD